MADPRIRMVTVLRQVILALVGILLVADGIYTVTLISQGKSGQAAGAGAFFVINVVLLVVVLRVKMPDL